MEEKVLRYIESEGYKYYVDNCRIWYGKEKYDKHVDIDYLNITLGELDYNKAFTNLMKREGLIFKDQSKIKEME